MVKSKSAMKLNTPATKFIEEKGDKRLDSSLNSVSELSDSILAITPKHNPKKARFKDDSKSTSVMVTEIIDTDEQDTDIKVRNHYLHRFHKKMKTIRDKNASKVREQKGMAYRDCKRDR